MSSFGGTIKLQKEDEYKKALRDITSNLKVMASEMKVLTSSYDKNDASTSDLSKTTESLNKKLEEQKKTVNVLKSALENSKKETGENSDTTKKWQIQLNNAQAEVNKTTKEINKNEKVLKDLKNANVDNVSELKKFEDAEKKAGEGAITLGSLIKSNLISEGIITGIKGLANGMKMVGSAIIDVGKQSVEGFASFEQLEGGVTKLFGEDMKAEIVKNANDAFKTAGMTANEYMETVTGFSASLISSLNGDTKKAAEISDMAIRDMSDNANTFGTDMASIQNAYQGFAKGNYTMLDNLKLGFAGSKEGMQSLLNKASEISGRKFDISSFADITEAIHIMQEEMKIAGTTQKEASLTIEGSINSMKSAWGNLITGLATDSADLSQLINNLVESVFGVDGEGGVLNNILPAINRVTDSVFEVLPQVLDTMISYLPSFIEQGQEIINKMVAGLQSNLPLIINAVMQIVMTLVTTIVQNLPQLLQMGIKLMVSLSQGLIQQLPILIPIMIQAVMDMVDTLLDNIDLIIDTGIELIMALADGLIKALPVFIDKAPVIIDKLINAITNNLPKIIEMGITLIVQLGVGLIKAIPQLISKVPQIISSIVSGFANYYSKLGEVGTNLIKGLWNGISDAGAWLRDKISGFFGGVVDNIKNFFGIHSPSTLFRDEIGTNLALGVGEGFSDTMSDVTKNMTNSIPTEFDVDANVVSHNKNNSMNYNFMVEAFKQALSEMKITLDDEVAGNFVEDRIGRVIYS